MVLVRNFKSPGFGNCTRMQNVLYPTALEVSALFESNQNPNWDCPPRRFFLFFVLQMTSKYDYSIMTRTMSCNEVYAIVLWLSQEILIKSQVFY